MTIDKATQDVIIARDEAVYTYGVHGRGPVYAYEGPKKMIAVFKDYVALVSPPKANAVARSTSLRAFGSSQADDIFNTSNFTLLDTDLKLIAHQEALSSQVNFVFSEWGDLFVLTLDGKVSMFYFLQRAASLTAIALSVPRKISPTKTRAIIPAQPIRPSNHSCTEGWG